MAKYTLYYVPLYNCYCTLVVATSPRGAMRQVNSSFSKYERYLCGCEARCAVPATEKHISDVRGMGGRVPELPKRQRKQYSSPNGSRKDRP